MFCSEPLIENQLLGGIVTRCLQKGLDTGISPPDGSLHPLLSSLRNIRGSLYCTQVWLSRPACNQARCIKQPDLQGKGPSRLLHIFPYANQRKVDLIFIDLRTRDVQLYFCQDGSVKLVTMCTPIRLQLLALRCLDSHCSVM